MRSNAAVAGWCVFFSALAVAGEELMLSDFESRESLRVIEARAKIELVSEHATQGERAGKVPAGFTIVAGGWTRLPADWSGYDQLRLDIYNPGEVAKVSITIADAEGNDYWKRHNNSFPLRPGKNTIAIPVGGMWRGEKGSGKFLDTKGIKQLVIILPRKGADAYYLDGFRLLKGAGKVEKRLLIGFEEGEKPGAKWNIEDWPPDAPGKSVATPVAEHATEGRRALKLQYRENGANITVRPLDPDWSGYDSLEIDCYNSSRDSVTIGGWFRDEVSKTGEYWQRYNYRTNVRPGASIIRFPLGGFYRGEKGSGKFLDTKKIVAFCIATRGVTLYYDNVRLVKGTEEVAVEGMRRFDFGPKASANFPGFTAVHVDTAYGAGRDYGWVGAAPGDNRNYEQPDTLFADFIRLGGETFAVDVPNGEYSVYAVLDNPGYWDYMFWRERMIDAEGREVARESVTPKGFLEDQYFRFQDVEDYPGTDIWEKYVQARFKPMTFKVRVSDGRLDLRFRGDTWGLTLCCLVVYPSSQKDAGARWLQQLDERRREEFYTNYAEVVRPADPKPKTSPEEEAAGLILFSRDLERAVTYNSAPGADSTDARDVKIAWAAVRGEYESAAFSVYPLKDCGQLAVKASDLSGPAGASVPASAFRFRAIRYKFKRIGGRITSSFDYRPWLLVDFDSWPVPAGVTRRFWVTLKVPEGTAPGRYAGKLTVSVAGGSREIPVSLEVYPFALDEPEMVIGMYGGSGPTGASYKPADVLSELRHQERIEEVYRDQKEHGMTCVTPPAPRFRGIRGGKAVFDYATADRHHALLRRLGYRHECYAYASMFRVREGDVEAEARKYGMSLEEAIKLAYDELGRHMKEHNWLPMAWALADEPLIHGISAEDVIKVFEAHRKAAPQMQFVLDDAMGDPAHWNVIPAIDIVCANTPRYKVAEAVKKAGGRYWFNNIGIDRVTFGWFLWKARLEMGVEALVQWGYSTNKADIYYDLDGSEGDSGVAFTASEGQRARRQWEMIREGADDHRYLQTLWNLMDAARAKGGAARAKASKAEQFAKDVMAKIDLENKGKKVYTSADFDGFKRGLAGHIIELRQALGRQAGVPAPAVAAAPEAGAPIVERPAEAAPKEVAVAKAPPAEPEEAAPKRARKKLARKVPSIYIAVGVAAVAAAVVVALMLVFRRKRS